MATGAVRLTVAVPDKIFGLTHILDFIDRCHSLRKSTRYIVPFPASRKFHPYLGFSSPPQRPFAFAGSPISLPPVAVGSLPVAVPGIFLTDEVATKDQNNKSHPGGWLKCYLVKYLPDDKCEIMICGHCEV